MEQYKNIAYFQSMNYVPIWKSNEKQIKKQKIPHCRNNSEIQHQNHFKEAKFIPQSHKYMTAHFLDLGQVLQ